MLTVIRILIGEIGLWGTIITFFWVAWAALRGEPFGSLPAPDCGNERQSRKQLAPAILLYRALMIRLPERALEVTEKVVATEGVRFMKKSLGKLKLKELPQMAQQERNAYVGELGERFFNAQIRWDHIGDEKVQFTVTHCRFPGLCQAAGAPELAILFCRVDEAYFGQVEPNLVLTRPHSIAAGAADCPFTLTRSNS
jgi:hypothetical protein